MDTATAPSRTAHPWVTYVQVALTLLTAAVLGWRTAATANGQGIAAPGSALRAVGTLAVGAATAAAVLAAVLLLAQRRRPAAAALGVALALELLVLGRVAAPPVLITAPLLALALALFALQGGRRVAGEAPTGRSSWHRAAGVVALVLMVPVGVLYLLLSGLVIPAPAIYAVYLLYGLLIAATALLARWRSSWALAVPPAALGLWFLVVTLGSKYLGWVA